MFRACAWIFLVTQCIVWSQSFPSNIKSRSIPASIALDKSAPLSIAVSLVDEGAKISPLYRNFTLFSFKQRTCTTSVKAMEYFSQNGVQSWKSFAGGNNKNGRYETIWLMQNFLYKYWIYGVDEMVMHHILLAIVLCQNHGEKLLNQLKSLFIFQHSFF